MGHGVRALRQRHGDVPGRQQLGPVRAQQGQLGVHGPAARADGGGEIRHVSVRRGRSAMRATQRQLGVVLGLERVRAAGAQLVRALRQGLARQPLPAGPELQIAMGWNHACALLNSGPSSAG
jgi:hypothetical protein